MEWLTGALCGAAVTSVLYSYVIGRLLAEMGKTCHHYDVKE